MVGLELRELPTGVQILHAPNPGAGEAVRSQVAGCRLVVGNIAYWRDFLLTLSKSDLEELSKIRREVYLEKFPSQKDKKQPLCRNVYRVFTDNDLLQFFNTIKPNETKFGIAFFLQLTCGFRIGEVARLKASKIDFQRGIVSLLTEKSNVYSDQPIPSITLELLHAWITTNQEQITAHNDYIFFSGNPLFNRDFVSPLVMRNYFQKFRKRANLTDSYADRKPQANKTGKLFKLTTHSFRRTYLTRIYQECRKKELVATLARHKKKDATDCYIFFDHQEQLELVNKVFNRGLFRQIAEGAIQISNYNK